MILVLESFTKLSFNERFEFPQKSVSRIVNNKFIVVLLQQVCTNHSKKLKCLANSRYRY